MVNIHPIIAWVSCRFGTWSLESPHVVIGPVVKVLMRLFPSIGESGRLLIYLWSGTL